jgi:hypothetical protein
VLALWGDARSPISQTHLRSQGCRRVTALVGREEAAAAGLWRAAGYIRDDHVDRFVRNL